MDEIRNVTIIGSGIMGAGIAHSIFKYGFDVTLYDINREELEKACLSIKSKARRNMDPEKIHMETDLNKALEKCDLVIEAVFEDLEVKCELFRTLGQIAPEKTVFASNTSSLSISAMAQASGRSDRFTGIHFFNPPLIMRLVELITQEKLSPDVLLSVKDFIKSIKKQAVICRESPGFIVNRILLPVINEAFYLLEEKAKPGNIIETANRIDSALVSQEILLMGPYNLADLTGIDTVHHVSDIIYRGFGRSPRYLSSPLLAEYFQNGYYGRKCRRGVYYYGNTENDPDLNPPLDSAGNAIEQTGQEDFNTLDLVCVMINEAFRIVEEGIVDDFMDIELAMELGTRWPKGPFRMAGELGVEKVLDHLKNRYRDSGENPRYEPSGLFRSISKELKDYFLKYAQ
jgi:enoyl-CoA hydratase / 3-hydroxyacyl-CoA dehydrogenase